MKCRGCCEDLQKSGQTHRRPTPRRSRQDLAGRHRTWPGRHILWPQSEFVFGSYRPSFRAAGEPLLACAVPLRLYGSAAALGGRARAVEVRLRSHQPRWASHSNRSRADNRRPHSGTSAPARQGQAVWPPMCGSAWDQRLPNRLRGAQGHARSTTRIIGRYSGVGVAQSKRIECSSSVGRSGMPLRRAAGSDLECPRQNLVRGGLL